MTFSWPGSWPMSNIQISTTVIKYKWRAWGCSCAGPHIQVATSQVIQIQLTSFHCHTFKIILVDFMKKMCFICQYINGFEQLYETFNKIDSALMIKQNLLIFKIFHRHSWGWLDDVWYNACQNHYLLINWSNPEQPLF